MTFAKRTEWPLIQNKLAQVLESKKQSGAPLIDLTQSNPTRCGLAYLTPEILNPLVNPKNLVYEPDPHGLLEAREAICGYYLEKGVRLHPNQLFLTAATSEAYSLLFRLLCNPGDQVLVPKPSYPLLDYLSDLNDIQTLPYDLRYDNGWSVDRGKFPRHLFKTKAFVVVNPNNPTGHFVSENDWCLVTRTCQRSLCAVLSDEVFFDYPWAAPKARTFASCEEVLSFTLGGVSKLLGLPQMKASWIVVSGPRSEKEEAIQKLEVIADTYLSVNTPAQNALSVWLRDRQAPIREIKSRCLENLGFLRQALAKQERLKLLEGEAGWAAILSLKGPLSDETLVVRLLEEHNVLVYPGYFFNFDSNKELVVSLLPPPPDFKKGLECLLKLI